MDRIQVIMFVHNFSMRLVKRWFWLVIFVSLALGGGYLLLRIWWLPQFANRWLGLAAIFSAMLLVTVWRVLPQNHRPGERTVLPHFGPGNHLTILRGVMIAFLAGFLLSPRPTGWLAWLPGLLYIAAALLDLFDGYFARRSNQVTRLGEILDMNLDGLGVLVACLLIVQYGQVPPWYLLVGLARYLFIAGEWILMKMNKPVYELAANPVRRPMAGAQMGFIGAVLIPVFSPPGTFLVAVLFGVPFLVVFAYDWLIVSGVLKSALISGADSIRNVDPELSIFSNWVMPVRGTITRWLPLASRIAVVLLLIIWLIINLPFLIDQWASFANKMSALTAYPDIWLGLMLLLTGVGLVFLALGAAGRLAALFIMVGLGMFQSLASLGPLEALLLIGATILMFLGTGPYSLWTPEEALITRRIGES